MAQQLDSNDLQDYIIAESQQRDELSSDIDLTVLPVEDAGVLPVEIIEEFNPELNKDNQQSLINNELLAQSITDSTDKII